MLGRQPEISLAELISLYGVQAQPFGQAAALIETADIDIDRLGGTTKLATVIRSLDTTRWPDIQRALAEIPPPPVETKLNLGLSFYGLGLSGRQALAAGLELKQAWKPQAVRIVPPKTVGKDTVISTAQALHNHLTASNGLELIVATDGQKTILAQTEQIQDIEAYGQRDFGRPARSAKVGMLPPKLAQILLNLAHPEAGATVFDPFCGTGVILQEALLSGYSVLGSDLTNDMVQYSKTNLDWLNQNHSGLPPFQLLQADAKQVRLPGAVGAVVSEGFLGQPLESEPSPSQLRQLKTELSDLTLAWLKNLYPQLASGTPVCFTLPAWRQGQRFQTLNILDQIRDIGYTSKQFARPVGDLIYHRHDQIVGREIITLTKP